MVDLVAASTVSGGGPTARLCPVSELRFEHAAGGRWLRYGMLAVCVAAVVFTLYARRWGLLLSTTAVLMGCSSLWLNAYTRTLVTRDRITVQHGWQRRDLPTPDVVAVAQRTAWSPVTAELVSGETVVLPRVEAVDLTAITCLIRSVSEE